MPKAASKNMSTNRPVFDLQVMKVIIIYKIIYL